MPFDTAALHPMDWFAWADAALLLVLVPVVVVAAQPGVDRSVVIGAGVFAVLVAHVALIVSDHVRNAQGFERFPNVVVGILLPPVYFGWRSVRFRYVNGWLMLLLWCVALVAQAMASGFLLGPTLQPQFVRTEVADQVAKILGGPATVDCPNNIASRPGGTFRCSAATVSGNRFTVVVVVSGSGSTVIAVPIFEGGVKPS